MQQRIKITWNQQVIQKIAEESGKKGMDVAREAASQIRCLDHGEVVRVIDRDAQTGDFKVQVCCEAAKKAEIEAIQRAFS